MEGGGGRGELVECAEEAMRVGTHSTGRRVSEKCF